MEKNKIVGAWWNRTRKRKQKEKRRSGVCSNDSEESTSSRRLYALLSFGTSRVIRDTNEYDAEGEGRGGFEEDKKESREERLDISQDGYKHRCTQNIKGRLGANAFNLHGGEG